MLCLLSVKTPDKLLHTCLSRFDLFDFSKRKMTGLQARLEKIDASTENGPSQGRDMSRNARLVLAAAAKVPRYALPPEANQQSSGRAPKKQISVSSMTKKCNTYEEFSSECF